MLFFDLCKRFIYTQRQRNQKWIFLFGLCCCSMWTLNWILYESIWKWCHFCFRSNIDKPFMNHFLLRCGKSYRVVPVHAALHDVRVLSPCQLHVPYTEVKTGAPRLYRHWKWKRVSDCRFNTQSHFFSLRTTILSTYVHPHQVSSKVEIILNKIKFDKNAFQ